ncbi:MAG: hypothetical protein ACTTJ1_01970 [Treponema sp.]
MNVYKQLSEGGAYNLPYLLHIFDGENKTHIYLINDNNPMKYKGKIYQSAAFNYVPSSEGDGTLSIGIHTHESLIDLLEENNYLKVEVVGIFNGEAVQEIGQYKHKYGSASWDGVKLELRMDKDDRGNMTFPALIFNAYNNRGNS